MSQTVIEFVHIHFDANWNRIADPAANPVKVTYTPVAATGAIMLVLREAPVGTLTTFEFNIPHNGQVWVSLHDNLVFLPEKPVRTIRGDAIPK